jgi:predicted AlkP superfamily pyrophosphatase or phosphodiesterase
MILHADRIAIACLALLSWMILSPDTVTSRGDESSTTPPRPKVLIIGIDGCRPDALRKAEMPHLDELIEDGALCLGTRIFPEGPIISDTISGPGWSSILTGVWADKHGVVNNEFTAPRYEEYPHFFRRLKDARPDAFTASYVDWAPIHERIVTAADVSRSFETEADKTYQAGDVQVASQSVEILATGDPTALFAYFGQVDVAGHAHGFHPTVPEYITAIENVDRHIGRLLAAMRQRRTFPQEDWLVIVCTDHGGRGTGHGGGHEQPEINQVFLITSGPSAARGDWAGPTSLVDVVPTALTHLGVPIDAAWKLDGQPVGLAREN